MTDLSLHLMDIMQNSIAADATRVEVGIRAEQSRNLLTIYVKDNGCGMSEETVQKVSDPFYTTRTTRKAGLGIPLFRASAEMAGGTMDIQSQPGKGTTISASYEIDHIDRKPLGDVASTITASITGYPEIDFDLVLQNDEDEYLFQTEDVRKQIGEVPINDIVIIQYLKEMIDEQIRSIFGGILNEIIS